MYRVEEKQQWYVFLHGVSGFHNNINCVINLPDENTLRVGIVQGSLFSLFKLIKHECNQCVALTNLFTLYVQYNLAPLTLANALPASNISHSHFF